MKKMIVIAIGMLLFGNIIIQTTYKSDTCGTSEEEVRNFLEKQDQQEVSLCKISKKDCIMAVIYD